MQLDARQVIFWKNGPYCSFVFPNDSCDPFHLMCDSNLLIILQWDLYSLNSSRAPRYQKLNQIWNKHPKTNNSGNGIVYPLSFQDFGCSARHSKLSPPQRWCKRALSTVRGRMQIKSGKVTFIQFMNINLMGAPVTWLQVVNDEEKRPGVALWTICRRCKGVLLLIRKSLPTMERIEYMKCPSLGCFALPPCCPSIRCIHCSCPVGFNFFLSCICWLLFLSVVPSPCARHHPLSTPPTAPVCASTCV